MDLNFELLIVEDSAADAALIQANLRVGLGKVNLRRVDRLSAAIEALATETYNVVLLDLNLPDSSGVETFRRLSARSAGTPIIVLSGMEDAETAIEAVGAGADDYVQKSHYDAQTLARSVRFAIERNSRRRAERELNQVRGELDAAQHIQDSLYPREAPVVPGLDIACGIQSAGIGCGDYYDFIPLHDGRLAIVVGDVSGHGMASAMVMAQTRACLRTLTAVNAGTDLILAAMNRLIYSATSEGMFVTLLLVIYDPAAGSFEYFNAGHPGWIVRSESRDQLATHQLPLGLIPELDYSDCGRFSLARGDILVMPTDGIAETPSGREMFGNDRLLSCIEQHRGEHAQEIVNHVFAAAMAYAEAEVPADDMTAVILKAL
ncbi:MAG: SpoIIE family protein phosphatase [Fuerstiella sp.]